MHIYVRALNDAYIVANLTRCRKPPNLVRLMLRFIVQCCVFTRALCKGEVHATCVSLFFRGNVVHQEGIVPKENSFAARKTPSQALPTLILP